MPEAPGPDFLKDKYSLHKSDEVESAAHRTEARGERVPEHDAETRIQNYLDRFTEILNREDPAKRERGLDALKEVLHDNFVIKSEEIPQSYWDLQLRIAREQGHGDIQITDRMKRELTEVVVTDQESSMDAWVDYLSSDDATYPDWLKYYAMRGVLGLGEYDKEKHQFRKRSKGTTKPFPDLNREALAYVLDAIEKQYAGGYVDLESLAQHDQAQLKHLLDGANFGKLYAFALEKVTPASAEELSSVDGKWIKYDQGSDAMSLVTSLQGHGTGWCTAGESTAKAQLQAGDFYVFYSHDAKGQPTVPRAAIRMQGDSIAEVRGIAKEQNLDPAVADLVGTKLKEFPDGGIYEQKASDMEQLTEVEKKVQAGEALNRVDLAFLYELDRPIQGFGYQKDPRVAELRNPRLKDEAQKQQDMEIIFDCSGHPEQITHTSDAITADTKAYVGPLAPGIFQKLAEHPNIEHVYTKFPECKIQRYQVELDGKTAQQLEDELKAQKIYVNEYAKYLLRSVDFEKYRTKTIEEVKLVRLTVADLGFGQGATTDEIYAKADELGLDLCPTDVGPQLRLQSVDRNWMFIAMKQIPDRSGRPEVFSLSGDDGELELVTDVAKPGRRWDGDSKFVFSIRK